MPQGHVIKGSSPVFICFFLTDLLCFDLFSYCHFSSQDMNYRQGQGTIGQVCFFRIFSLFGYLYYIEETVRRCSRKQVLLLLKIWQIPQKTIVLQPRPQSNLKRGCFPAKYAKFLRTPILKNIYEQLLVLIFVITK